MTSLYLELRSGMSGDMFLAALGGLGVELSELEALFSRGGITVGIRLVRERKSGLAGQRLDLALPPEQEHRNLQDLLDILSRLPVSTPVRNRSAAAFHRLAEVEAAVHGIEVASVHFHEVGALDTLVDVVGVFWALEKLGVDRVVCSPLPWFRGVVDTDHGTLPLPAPATAELLKGKPVYPTEMEAELITPTGALLLDQLVREFADGPLGVVRQVSMGWGTMDLGEVPNGVRAFLVEEEHRESVWLLETNIDHLTGEEIGELIQTMIRSGARDAIYLPGLMKKNRPGGLFQVMCTEDAMDRMEALLFQHTLTLGIRRSRVARRTLPRQGTTLKSPLGAVQSKEFDLEGQTYARPEFDAIVELARRLGLSPVQVRLLLQAGSKQNS